MSQQYAWPSSSRLELEAQRFHVKSTETVSAEMAPALVLARWPAFFDLFACGFAAVLAFPQVFFPELGRVAAVLAGLALAALPLAVSPLGAMLGRFVAGRYGRAVGITGGQFILGAATTAMAFVPGDAQAGLLGVVLLVGCRLVQGVSAGAAWGGQPGRPAERDLALVSAALGLAIGGGAVVILSRVLSAADFADWGWRYPFAIGFAVNIVGLFANLRGLAVAKVRIAWGGSAGRGDAL